LARYTEKTDADIAWDEIRREVQYRINLAAANWRMTKLNEILPRLQDQFEVALNKGTLLALESKNVAWISEALDEEPGA
jgi:hypothetical protein